MLNCQSMMPSHEGEEHVIAAAQHILKALRANKNLNEDFVRVLTELDSHLSKMTILTESNNVEFSNLEEQLKSAERKITRWEENPSLIWSSGPKEAAEYLHAVNEIQTVMENLGGLSVNLSPKLGEFACRAKCALQIAMSRLEEELYHIFYQHKQFFEPEQVSFRSCAKDMVYDESFVLVEDEMVAETSQRNTNGRESAEYTADLVDPHIIPTIKSIANVMFTSNFDKEFCETFIGIRKAALHEYLSILNIENLSIEDLLKLEWDSLSEKVKIWMWVMKIIIRVYLPSEKRLCDQILGDFGSVASTCFLEIAKGSILFLLNFAEGIAMGPHKPERLFRLLDMYEVFAELQLHIDTLFSEDAGTFVRIEFYDLLRRLGESAKMTFLEFRNAIAYNASERPFPRGGIHHLTRYVMNFMRTLTIYSNTLNVLLKDEDIADADAVVEAENGLDISPSTFSPLACHFRSFASTLEANLIGKSRLYKDVSLQSVFLMNNIHYMVQKVMDLELRPLFGDEWIRKHKGKFQQHATSYERESWSSVVNFLRNDGTSYKERCRRFCIAFEEVYKIQTQWCIPDPKLREDLQISTSQKVVHAYQTFLGVNNRNVCEKHIKYTADDLQKMLLDLFVGSTKSMRNSRRW